MSYQWTVLLPRPRYAPGAGGVRLGVGCSVWYACLIPFLRTQHVLHIRYHAKQGSTMSPPFFAVRHPSIEVILAKARIHQVVPRGSVVAYYPHDEAWQVTLYARLRRPCSVQTWVWILDQVEDDWWWSAAVVQNTVPVGLAGNGRRRAKEKRAPPIQQLRVVLPKNQHAARQQAAMSPATSAAGTRRTTTPCFNPPSFMSVQSWKSTRRPRNATGLPPLRVDYKVSSFLDVP